MAKRLRIAVVSGGISDERDVSLASGKNVVTHLPPQRFAVVPVEIKKNGSWKRGARTYPATRYAEALRGIDLVFNALHGSFGEDGRIQALLEQAGIPYTGSRIAASAIGMDKAKTKEVVSAQGVVVPRSVFLDGKRSSAQNIARIRNSVGFPCVIKPNASGSSVGITIARTASDALDALRLADVSSVPVLVEEFIAGRELTCGVLGNAGGDLFALPPVEIVPDGDFFDYRAKYHSKRTQEICPAKLTRAQTVRIQELAKMAHKAVGCDGLTRSDFILTKNGKIVFLEINTLPGLTPASLCPKEAAALGWSFSDLLERIIGLAIRPWASGKVQSSA